MSPTQAFISLLPEPAGDADTTALASFKTERFVPANTVTKLTLTNQPISDFTRVYKDGVRLDTTGAYTVAGSVVTLTVAANGSNVFLVDYYFRAGR